MHKMHDSHGSTALQSLLLSQVTCVLARGEATSWGSVRGGGVESARSWQTPQMRAGFVLLWVVQTWGRAGENVHRAD